MSSLLRCPPEQPGSSIPSSKRERGGCRLKALLVASRLKGVGCKGRERKEFLSSLSRTKEKGERINGGRDTFSPSAFPSLPKYVRSPSSSSIRPLTWTNNREEPFRPTTTAAEGRHSPLRLFGHLNVIFHIHLTCESIARQFSASNHFCLPQKLYSILARYKVHIMLCWSLCALFRYSIYLAQRHCHREEAYIACKKGLKLAWKSEEEEGPPLLSLDQRRSFLCKL